MRLLVRFTLCWLFAAVLIVYSPLLFTIIAAIGFYRYGFDRPKRKTKRRTR